MFRLAAILAFVLPALGNPAPRGLEVRQSCAGQSCTIAALSGSSGQPYNPSTPPQGGSDSGDCCIISYNPSVAPALYQEKPELQSQCAAQKSKKRGALAAREIANIERQACAPYTLIFARGTSEVPTLGETVGPALASGLKIVTPGQWSIQGVPYDASIDGDDCLGLPGGQIAAQLLASVASSCPNTKIVMSGYSEGAMVVRDGVAYATAAARARVDGVVTFGDPFNGAPIKGYSKAIQTYCAQGDEVCDGLFQISLAHLSYVGVDTTEAVAYINNLVK